MNKRLSPNEDISNLVREKLEVFKASIRDDGTYKDSIYKGAQSASQQIASDYGSRFLVELIQNAYDAHNPDCEDGKIKILLIKEEDKFGALYIANKGRGFLWNDVESLCNIGTSNKPVGQSIGNKGLGFRSVRYITDDPQIYSKSENGFSQSFDGYCFRFARGNDFDQLLDDPHHRELAKKDIPFFHIPIPLTVHLPIVNTFASDGYSTVIRLPLRNEPARQIVVKLFEEFRSQNVPLLIFLRRIDTLEIIVDGGVNASFTLKRETKSLPLERVCQTEDKYSVVNLGNDGKYLIAWYMIPEAIVKTAIIASVELGQLHPAWEDWKGDGELAVAVKLNGDVISPRLYTYLPMGDQIESPFYGYLHGSFYPKADRTDLDASIPVNGLYIDEAARLCVRTVMTLRKAIGNVDGILSPEERKTAMVDFLAWNQSQCIERDGTPSAPILIRQAFLEQGVKFAESDVLPIIKRKGNNDWGTANEVWRWDQPDLQIFSAHSLSRIMNIAILSPELGTDRVDRLENFITSGDENLTVHPTDLEISQMAEIVATHVVTPQSSKKTKMDFYMELEKIFRNKAIDLSERKILYCADGILRASVSKEMENQDQPDRVGNTTSRAKKKRGRRARLNPITVFAPSSRSIDEIKDSKGEAQIPPVPKELEKTLAFLNDELDWYAGLEKVRIFFEQQRLVRRYDADALIVQVSILSHSNRKPRTRQAALLWVFNLWSTYQNTQRSLSLSGANLLVPTLNNKWIEADQAIFSAGWPAKTFGNVSEEFLLETSAYGDELLRMRVNLLAHKTVKPFLSQNLEQWTDFLKAIGVNKGLQPLQIESQGFEMWGSNLTAENICTYFQTEPSINEYWQKDIKECGKRPDYRNSIYKLDGSLWIFPGQAKHNNFSEEAKVRYAQLILLWLESGQTKYFEFALFSPGAGRYISRFNWPSPFTAFLRQANWFPVEIQDGLNSQRKFLKPSDVWLPNNEEDNYYLPPYIPSIPRTIRTGITIDYVRKRLVEQCDVNILNDSVSLPRQVWYLGRLFKQGGIDYYHLKAFLNLYYETWFKLASSGLTIDKLNNSGDKYLITKQRNQYTSVIINHLGALPNITNLGNTIPEEAIYVRDTKDNLGIDLAVKQGFQVFDPGPQTASGIAKLLRSLLAERFRASSEIKITLMVDGEEYIPEMIEENFAVNVCPWLPYVVYLSMESSSGMVAQHLPADRSTVINQVNNIHIRHARNVQYKVGDAFIPLNVDGQRAIALNDTHKPLLLIQSDVENLDWNALADASSQFAQLIGQTDLTLSIMHCFRLLERIEEPTSGPIADLTRGIDALCGEFGIDKEHEAKALEGLNNNLVRLGRFLRPIIHYFKGVEASEEFIAVADQAKSLPDLIELLKTYLVGTQFSAETIVSTCQRASNIGFVRDELGFSFGKFNRSLVAVGDDPDVYSDSHVGAVRSFVAEHKDTIMACLRTHFMEQFRKGQSLAYFGVKEPPFRSKPAGLSE
jgi:hypothetical protein